MVTCMVFPGKGRKVFIFYFYYIGHLVISKGWLFSKLATHIDCQDLWC